VICATLSEGFSHYYYYYWSLLLLEIYHARSHRPLSEKLDRRRKYCYLLTYSFKLRSACGDGDYCPL